MDLLLNSDQEQIVDSTASFVSGRLPLTRLHGKEGDPAQTATAVWGEIVDMGWLGMTLPEASGGVGYTDVEEALVFREQGRTCAPPRILFTALAAKAAQAAGQSSLASDLASGNAVAAYAAQDDFAGSPTSLSTRRLYEVVGATHALLIDDDLVRLIALSGHNLEPQDSLDKSVSMSVADLSSLQVVAEVQTPAIRRSASLLTAALFVGMAEATRDLITEYAKLRETFGKPIGSYQAVRHPIAEMAVRCEEARAQLFYSSLLLAEAGGEGTRDQDLHVSSARLLAERAAVKNADDNIQLHGGIGVTDEFTAHFYMKRAQTMQRWFGASREHLARVLAAPMSPF